MTISRKKSLLCEAIAKSVMAVARRNLEEDGYLMSVLFIRITQEEAFSIPLTDFHRLRQVEARQAAMISIGKQLRDKGYTIAEAAMVLHGRTIKKQELVHPRQHLFRQDALLYIGRNASNTFATTVLQPFTRDANDRPIWAEISEPQYNVATEPSTRPTGLLDYLFEVASETH